VTTAFVLSGGGNLGAVQVGMLRALSDAGIVPDLLIGTSAGALNAAFVAAHGTDGPALDALQEQWVKTRRRDVFAIDPARHVRAVVGSTQSLFRNTGLRRIVQTHLAGVQLEGTATPIRVIATELLSGREAVLSSGSAVTAILASTAIPGVFPPVAHDGGPALVDGGLADNTAVSVAVEEGADRVIVLPTGYPCALPGVPRSAVAISLQSLGILIQQRLITDMVRMRGRAHIATMPPLCPLRVSPLDFGRARELIERAHRDSTRWIADGGLEWDRPERFLSLHSHPQQGDPPAR
jgi:NTE family protein